MNFGKAIEALKDGESVARDGWNGKGMFLVLVGGTNGTCLSMSKGSEYYSAGVLAAIIDPHIDMFTAQGTMQPGWLASQADMLADDWGVV